MNRRVLAIAELQLFMLTSALVYVLAKSALARVPAFSFAWLQIAIGGTLLTLYTFGVRGKRLPKGLPRSAWIQIAWIGVGNFAVVRVTQMLSLERLPATTHAYLTGFVGLVTMGISVLLLRERPSWLQLAGALLALLGLRIFFREIPAPTEQLGLVYLAVMVLALASTNNVARMLGVRAGERLSNDVLSTLALWIGGAPVVLAGLVFDWPPPVPDARSWAIVATNGVVTIAVGLTLFNHVLRTLRSYEASVLSGTGMIWTVLFAFLILGERLALHQVLGVGTMLVGVALVQLRVRQADSPAA